MNASREMITIRGAWRRLGPANASKAIKEPSSSNVYNPVTLGPQSLLDRFEHLPEYGAIAGHNPHIVSAV